MKGALEKSGVKPEDVNQLVMGNIIANDEQKGFLHRQTALGLGMKEGTIASEANRLCGTGFEVLRLAARGYTNKAIGEAGTAIADGADCDGSELVF